MTDPKRPPREPQPGAIVSTPTGREARVLRVDERLREGTIQWANGDRAAFRFVHLKRSET
jgi:hypothetical protein